jgi:hypothetical protein
MRGCLPENLCWSAAAFARHQRALSCGIGAGRARPTPPAAIEMGGRLRFSGEPLVRTARRELSQGALDSRSDELLRVGRLSHVGRVEHMTHLLFCDETTIKRENGENFFLYGGLVVSPDQFEKVCDLVAEVRSDLGLRPDEPLKFSPKTCPPRIARTDWTAAKDRLLRGLSGLKLKFIGIYILESIASSDEKTHWAIDALCVQFDEILESAKARGAVIVDHTRDVQRADMVDIASGAVAVSVFLNELPRIGGIGSAHVEAMLPLQATDVVLGAYRYCFEHPKHDVCVDIWRSIAGLDSKLQKRPRQIKLAHFDAEYKALRQGWVELSERATLLSSSSDDHVDEA